MQEIEDDLRMNHLNRSISYEPPAEINKERILSDERADEIIVELKKEAKAIQDKLRAKRRR